MGLDDGGDGGDDKHQSSSTAVVQYELNSFSAGAIADLVHLQRQQQQQSDAVVDGGALSYYQPIDVHQLSGEEERDPQEPSRIETRLHALHEQLRRIAPS